MTKTVVPLDECFPNPDATYLIRGIEEVRLRGDSKGMDTRLRALAQSGARAWFVGSKEWTNLPEEVLGTWVRNARNEVRWASLSDIAARADGIDEAYSRSVGWVRVPRESSAVDPQYEGRCKDFLAWRARHADTARVAWDPTKRPVHHDADSADADRFMSIARRLTARSSEERDAAFTELKAEFPTWGQSRYALDKTTRLLAEAGTIESLAYLLDRGERERRGDVLALFGELSFCDAGHLKNDEHSYPFYSDTERRSWPASRGRVYSDVILETLLRMVRDEPAVRDAGLKAVTRMFSRLKWAPGALLASWSSTLLKEPLGSVEHAELCLAVVSLSESHPLITDLEDPSRSCIGTISSLLSRYIDLDREHRARGGNCCLADKALDPFWVRDIRKHAVRGLTVASERSRALRAGVQGAQLKIQNMLEVWENLRQAEFESYAQKQQQRLEAFGKVSRGAGRGYNSMALRMQVEVNENLKTWIWSCDEDLFRNFAALASTLRAQRARS